MIQLYAGDGKGKTTAAVGQAIRAVGNGWKVIFAQFMKGNETGELEVLKKLSQVHVCRSCKEFGFYHTLTIEEKEELTKIHNEILEELLQAVRDGDCNMIVMDEITYPVKWGLLDEEKLRLFLEEAKNVEVILTGRDPDEFLLNCADYITDMCCERHPYERGVEARKGIEY